MCHFAHVAATIAALVVGGGAVATTAHAQSPAGYYVAVPVAPPTRTSMITRTTPWHLNQNAYVAAKAPERDIVLCELVARENGALSSFTVGGKAFDADQLTKCNAHAKGGAAAAAVAAR